MKMESPLSTKRLYGSRNAKANMFRTIGLNPAITAWILFRFFIT